jgi:hypothetical protein
MENENKITPVGLKGREINERMIQLMGIKPINENNSKSVVELTKIGPDGIAYAIVRENHEYYIKTSTKKSNLITEDFGYIGGLQNKKSEVYPSYAKAIKHLNLKFNSLSESLDKGHNINVFENDNLLKENGIAGFSNYSGNGFSGQGNLDGDASLFEEEEKVEEDVENEVELTEVEQAVEDMVKEDRHSFGGVFKSFGDVIKYVGEDYNFHIEPQNGKFVVTMHGTGFPNGKMLGSFDDIDSAKQFILKKDNNMGESMGTTPMSQSIGNSAMNETKLTINRALKNMDSIIDGLTEGTLKKKVYTLK